MRIEYVDGKGASSRRTIRPIAVEYYTQATLVCAWCELRDGYRHFRADRIAPRGLLTDGFRTQATTLLAGWVRADPRQLCLNRNICTRIDGTSQEVTAYNV